jgi:hypothetical protein
VIAVVSGLHDERGIPALLGAIKTGGMATRGLAEFGRKAFAPVLRLLSSPDPMTRAAAVFALREMLEMGKLNDRDCEHKRGRSFALRFGMVIRLSGLVRCGQSALLVIPTLYRLYGISQSMTRPRFRGKKPTKAATSIR